MRYFSRRPARKPISHMTAVEKEELRQSVIGRYSSGEIGPLYARIEFMTHAGLTAAEADLVVEEYRDKWREAAGLKGRGYDGQTGNKIT